MDQILPVLRERFAHRSPFAFANRQLIPWMRDVEEFSDLRCDVFSPVLAGIGLRAPGMNQARCVSGIVDARSRFGPACRQPSWRVVAASCSRSVISGRCTSSSCVPVGDRWEGRQVEPSVEGASSFCRRCPSATSCCSCTWCNPASPRATSAPISTCQKGSYARSETWCRLRWRSTDSPGVRWRSPAPRESRVLGKRQALMPAVDVRGQRRIQLCLGVGDALLVMRAGVVSPASTETGPVEAIVLS